MHVMCDQSAIVSIPVLYNLWDDWHWRILRPWKLG